MTILLTEYIDLHERLLHHHEVLDYLICLENSSAINRYCKGGNAAGRLFFQFYNKEFLEELAYLINIVLEYEKIPGPVLEVMSGDGKLTEFLRPLVRREILATDFKDPSYNIEYPKWVTKIDADLAVEYYNPSLVLICWEPFFSTVSASIYSKGIPMLWIGERARCGAYSDIFELDSLRLGSQYALGRNDNFGKGHFLTDVYLFNCEENWFQNLELR